MKRAALISLGAAAGLAFAVYLSNSGAGVVVSQPSISGATPGALNLYVDTAGNDALSCQAGAACKTIQGAVNRVPKTIKHPVVINVGEGTFTNGAYVEGFTFLPGAVNAQVGAYLMIRGTMATATGLDGLMEGTVASATVGVGSTWGTVTVTGAGWTVDQLQGRLLDLVTGTGAGQSVQIATNTADTLTLAASTSSDWTVPTAGTTFRILDWKTILSTTAPGTVNPPGGSGTKLVAAYNTTLVGMVYVGENNVHNSTFSGNPPISIQRLKFTGASGYSAIQNLTNFTGVHQCRFEQAGIGVNSPGTVFGRAGTITVQVRQCSSNSATGAMVSATQYGNVVARGNVSTGAASYIQGARGSVGDTTSYLKGCTSSSGTIYSLLSEVSLQRTRFTGCAVAAVVGSSSYRTIGKGSDLLAIDVDASSGTTSAFVVYAATAYLTGVTGTGNTSYGLVLSDGAYAQIASTTTVTGSAGDVQMDGVTYSYATMRALTPKSIVDLSTLSRFYE